MTNRKATEDQFNELHNLVTNEFLKRIKSGEATAQDLKAACDWLHKNDISGVAYEGNPLDKLSTILPKVDPELVHSRLYPKTYWLLLIILIALPVLRLVPGLVSMFQSTTLFKTTTTEVTSLLLLFTSKVDLVELLLPR